MNLQAWFFVAIGLSTLTGCGGKPDSGTGSEATPSIDPKTSELRDAGKTKLYTIAEALNNFGMTPGIFDESGKKIGLSWRVAILLSLKQEKLYAQFKLDEPWDSTNNKKLIAQMPSIFASPGKPAGEGMTFYRSFTGKETVMPPPVPGKAVPGSNGKIAKGIEIPGGISDGFGNTAMIADAAEAVIWTKPDELEFDRSKPLPKLGGAFDDGFHIAFASQEVHFFRKGTLTDDTFRAIITPNGGEMVTLPDGLGVIQSNAEATKR